MEITKSAIHSIFSRTLSVRENGCKQISQTPGSHYNAFVSLLVFEVFCRLLLQRTMRKRSAYYKKACERAAVARESRRSSQVEEKPLETGFASPAAEPGPSTQPAPPLPSTPAAAASPVPQPSTSAEQPSPGQSKKKTSTLAVRERLLGDVSLTPSETKKKESLLIDKDELLRLFDATSASCGTCMGKVELRLTKRSADTHMEARCKVCEAVVFSSAPMTAEKPSLTENNVNFVAFSLTEVLGYAGYSRLTSRLSLVPLSRVAYYEHTEYIGNKILAVQEKKRKDIIDLVFKHYEQQGKLPDKNGILNVSGSFDGSWHTRGHTSHIGMGCFIEMDTGTVLDHEVISNYCIQCARLLTRKRKKKIRGKVHFFAGKTQRQMS